METFHIVLTALFAVGTCANICLIMMFFDPRIHTLFNIGTSILLLIIFYSVAAYSIGTGNYIMYWANFTFNAVLGTWNTKRILTEYENLLTE